MSLVVFGSRLGGIILSMSLLTSCIVGGQVFFSNESANQYRVCLNESLNSDPVFMNGLMSMCYEAVTDDGSCEKINFNYIGCNSILEQYKDCGSTQNLREKYLERCVNE